MFSLLEHLSSYKIIGSTSEVSPFRYSRGEGPAVAYKLQLLNGRDLMESSLRVKAELLKSTRGGPSIVDTGLLLNLYLDESSPNYPAAASLGEYFSKFRISESTKRMLSTNRSLLLPDTPIIRAQITSADVIHS